jgi:hypothetical protein
MAQVSRPVQVLLALTLVFGLVWFLALRPKPAEPSAPASAPSGQGESAIPGGPGNALDKARSGAGKANADNTARPGAVDSAASGAPGAPGGAAAPARPGGAPTGSPASATGPAGIVVTGAPVARGASPAAVTRALGRSKAVVVLFHGRGSDDSLVRSELSKVARRGGRVAVFSASIDRVSDFGALTTGVKVMQSPTVVVAGPVGQGRALRGYTDSTEIDQAVTSVLPAR